MMELQKIKSQFRRRSPIPYSLKQAKETNLLIPDFSLKYCLKY